jgi:hypothetical protein
MNHLDEERLGSDRHFVGHAVAPILNAPLGVACTGAA